MDDTKPIEQWKGIYKIIEEVGELLQVLGKLGPFPNGLYPDYGPNLRHRVVEELADAQATIEYFIEVNKLDAKKIADRKEFKKKRFYKWELTGIR